MAKITRLRTTQRLSQTVVHRGTVYLSGQVGLLGQSVENQIKTALECIDSLLQEAGSSRECILKAEIWLANIHDYDSINRVWDAWVPAGHSPARACCESKMIAPGYLVEVLICAAVIGDDAIN